MAIIGVQSSAVATESAAPRAGAMAGFTLAPAGVRAPLTPFTDEKGTKLTLADFRGKVVTLFFGFTHCPDVCPTTLSDMAKALKVPTPMSGQAASLFRMLVSKGLAESDGISVLKLFDPDVRL